MTIYNSSNFTANDRTPFTYLATHKSSGKQYYGSKSSKGCLPSDLGEKYFTSSKIVKEIIKKEGINSFIWEVRIICKTREQARIFEAKVLHKIDASHRENWFNLSNGTSGFIAPKIQSEKTKKLRSLSLKGRASWNKGIPSSLETCKKQSKTMKTKPSHPQSEESKIKISKNNKGKVAWNKGRKETDEEIQKRIINNKKLPKRMYIQNNIFETQINIQDFNLWESKGFRKGRLPKNKKECPFCNKLFDYTNYARYHGDICKQNPNKI